MSNWKSFKQYKDGDTVFVQDTPRKLRKHWIIPLSIKIKGRGFDWIAIPYPFKTKYDNTGYYKVKEFKK